MNSSQKESRIPVKCEREKDCLNRGNPNRYCWNCVCNITVIKNNYNPKRKTVEVD